MQAGVGLLVADMMSIYMIMPRYSHNYALFYQLLDSNLFIHHNTYAILRESTSETYGPRVYFPSYESPVNELFLAPFILLYLLLIFIIKVPKILSYHLYQISLLQVAVKGLTTPLSRWLQGSYLFV